jgi:hypothetical protein
MQLVREIDVANKATFAGDQRWIFQPLDTIA